MKRFFILKNVTCKVSLFHFVELNFCLEKYVNALNELRLNKVSKNIIL